MDGKHLMRIQRVTSVSKSSGVVSVDGALVVHVLVEYNMLSYGCLARYLNVYIHQLTISASCISPNDKIRMSTLTSTACTKRNTKTVKLCLNAQSSNFTTIASRVRRHPL